MSGLLEAIWGLGKTLRMVTGKEADEASYTASPALKIQEG